MDPVFGHHISHNFGIGHGNGGSWFAGFHDSDGVGYCVRDSASTESHEGISTNIHGDVVGCLWLILCSLRQTWISIICLNFKCFNLYDL